MIGDDARGSCCCRLRGYEMPFRKGEVYLTGGAHFIIKEIEVFRIIGKDKGIYKDNLNPLLSKDRRKWKKKFRLPFSKKYYARKLSLFEMQKADKEEQKSIVK